jgi:hypothetical protein
MAAAVEGFTDLAAAVCLVAACLACALGGLIVLGLGVHALSKFVGVPLPTVHDDPNRTEWGGLGLDALYGCIGAAALFACYGIGRRLLAATARDRVGKVLAALALVAVAIAVGGFAVDERDLRAAVIAVAAGVGAWRVARGAWRVAFRRRGLAAPGVVRYAAESRQRGTGSPG